MNYILRLHQTGGITIEIDWSFLPTLWFENEFPPKESRFYQLVGKETSGSLWWKQEIGHYQPIIENNLKTYGDEC